MDLQFRVVDITRRHLEVVKKPKHGYGGNMNPCIDCHALMFRVAGEMLELTFNTQIEARKGIFFELSLII